MVTIEQVVKNLKELEETLLSLPLEGISATPPIPIIDLEDYMASDKEVAKAIIKSKNPKLRKRDVDRMVDGATQSTSGLEGQYLPIGEDSSTLEESRQLKKQIRKAFKSFLLELKKIGADVADTVVVIVNSIPSISIMIAAPPWNVPAAIVTVMLIIKLLKDLLMAVFRILIYLDPLSRIGLVLPPESISKVLTPLNGGIVFLNNILNPLQSILNFITKLVESLKRRRGDCEKQEGRINRQIKKKRRIRNRKQRKLNRNNSPANKWIKDNNQNWKGYYFQADTETEIPFSFAERLTRNDNDPDENNPDNEDFIDLLDDWDDLNEELKTLELQLKNVCGEPDDSDIQTSLNQLDSSVKNVDNLFQEITTSLNTYSVKFPDGTIRRGVTQDELEGLREVYDIEIRDRFDIDFGASTPATSEQSNRGSSDS
jgi:archaellum component FlaC